MAKTYETTFVSKICYLPPRLSDWLPENYFAYFVSDVVDQLDLSAIELVYETKERGQPTAPSADDDEDFDL